MRGFDDLIFESRNKDYGAYLLRKKYSSAVIRGTIAAVLIGCTTVIIPFLSGPRENHIYRAGGRYVSVKLEDIGAVQENLFIPPSPPPRKPENLQAGVSNFAPILSDTEGPVETKMATADEIYEFSGDTSSENNPGYSDYLLTGERGFELNEPLFIVEVMPSFHGGNEKKFRDWVERRIIYPQEALSDRIKGTVILTFVVEKDGSVSNVNIVKGVNTILDSAAVKAVSDSPRWSPGLQRGQPVRVMYIMPIVFAF